MGGRVKNHIKVLKPGFFSSLQDKGRKGYLRLGIPYSGPMDAVSQRAANYLVSNNPFAPAIEMIFQGPMLEFTTEAYIGLAGAKMEAFIDDQPIPQYETVRVNKGSVLKFSRARSGLVGYLAIAGVIGSPEKWGSVSTHYKGKLGGKILQAQDVLFYLNNPSIPPKKLPNFMKLSFPEQAVIRVVKGPEFNLFDHPEIEKFFDNTYEITTESNRMGIRLSSSNPLKVPTGEMLSSGIIPGTIQVSTVGEPIVMSVDHQTAGGYPRIANVITNDLCHITQLAPGQTLKFRLTSPEKAIAILRKRERTIEELFTK